MLWMCIVNCKSVAFWHNFCLMYRIISLWWYSSHLILFVMPGENGCGGGYCAEKWAKVWFRSSLVSGIFTKAHPTFAKDQRISKTWYWSLHKLWFQSKSKFMVQGDTIGLVDGTVASQQEGPWFKSQTGGLSVCRADCGSKLKFLWKGHKEL